MTTAYSTNLGLALPVEGELSGTWGDMVNNGITDYLDIAVAGTLTLNGDGAVTLANTNGDTSGTNISSTTAQYAVIKVTGTLTTTKVITAPSHSKTYIVDNSATGGTVTLKASGQTGISVAVGEKCTAYFNGTDFVKVATSTAVTGAGGSNTQVQYNSSGALAGSANMTFNGTTLTLANDASVSGLTVGKGAGAVSTNTAVGASALAANTTGVFLTAVGETALTANTSGNVNDAFGKNALKTNTTGGYNKAFGAFALEKNTTGSNNVAMGDAALNNNTTASNNTAVGYQSLYSNTTAANNTVVGHQAGYSNTTGTRNVFIGNLAGYTSTADYNTIVGSQAGQLTSTGTLNTFIGVGSGSQITTGSKNSILGGYGGNSGGLDIRTASNYIVLADGDGNPRMYSNGSGILYDQYGKLRAVPAVGTKTSSYTLATTDVGRYVQLGASGAIVIPDATFAEGDVVSIFNNTASTATITCSITTAYIAGTYTDKATMTLAAAGVATVLFISGTLCVVSGNVT